MINLQTCVVAHVWLAVVWACYYRRITAAAVHPLVCGQTVHHAGHKTALGIFHSTKPIWAFLNTAESHRNSAWNINILDLVKADTDQESRDLEIPPVKWLLLCGILQQRVTTRKWTSITSFPVWGSTHQRYIIIEMSYSKIWLISGMILWYRPHGRFFLINIINSSQSQRAREEREREK